MDLVGLSNRLLARFGLRLLLTRDLEDERRASALAIEALEQRLERLTASHRSLTGRPGALAKSHAALSGSRAALGDAHAELAQTHADDQARFCSKLHAVRQALDHSRTAEAGARDLAARQAAAFAERAVARPKPANGWTPSSGAGSTASIRA